MRKLWRFKLQALHRSRSWLWAVLLFSLVPIAFSATFTASLDRSTVVLGEQVTLTLKFEDGQPQEISNLPQVDGLRIASSVNQSVSSVFSGGAQSTVYSYTVALEPTHIGEFVIPPFRAKVNGQTLSSQALRLKVAASDPSAPPASLANSAGFLWVVLPKTNLYIHETMGAGCRIL